MHGLPPGVRVPKVRGPVPASAGIGLRAQHHVQVLAETPRAAWFEAHSENYFADGGAQVECLSRIRERYPLSLHGVGLSLGSTDPLNTQHLTQVRRAVARFEPALVSEHLSWSSVGGVFANDLLPLPYTEEALRHVALRIAQTQDALGRQILIENVSSYLEFEISALTEWDFLASVAAESGCGILLDLNNIYVAARNHGFDCGDYLQAIPRSAVQEFHLAGHTRIDLGGGEILIDTHGTPVCDDVWDLYRAALRRFGDVPTLIEWTPTSRASRCCKPRRKRPMRCETKDMPPLREPPLRELQRRFLDALLGAATPAGSTLRNEPPSFDQHAAVALARTAAAAQLDRAGSEAASAPLPPLRPSGREAASASSPQLDPAGSEATSAPSPQLDPAGSEAASASSPQLDPAGSEVTSLIALPLEAALPRFGIYRNNVRANFVDALHSATPSSGAWSARTIFGRSLGSSSCAARPIRRPAACRQRLCRACAGIARGR